MRTIISILAGVILGVGGTAVAVDKKADPARDGLPIHCETYTKTYHSCTVKDTGSPYHIRLRYLLNGERFFIDSIKSTCPLSLEDQSNCRRVDTFTGPGDK